jgi:hypothetical protein
MQDGARGTNESITTSLLPFISDDSLIILTTGIAHGQDLLLASPGQSGEGHLEARFESKGALIGDLSGVTHAT